MAMEEPGKTGVENIRLDESALEGPEGGRAGEIRGMPDFGGITRWVAYGIGVLVSSLSVYEALWGNFEPALQRPLHIFLMCTLTFIFLPSGFLKNGSMKEGVLNLILITLLGMTTFWVYLNWTELYIDPYTTTFGIIMCSICILLVLEATRRSVGPAMVIISMVMVLYCFVGPYLPKALAHPGFTFENVVLHSVVGTEGMMGLLLSISVNQIIFFMLFAAFLEVSNSTGLFMNLAKALAGSYTGGPAKVAVVSSGFMGMVSGSASGNAATCGAITIPLMISMGFRRHIAAAIESIASTGGQFMPPIMGAAAFVIAEYTGASYWGVCKAAVLPAVFYYIGMFVVVDIEARMSNLRGLPKSMLPPLGPSFLKTVPLILPIAVLTTLLGIHYSPQMAILVSIMVLIAVCVPIKNQRMNLKRIGDGLALGAKILIPIATSCATCGLIVGVMSLTGFGNRLSYAIVSIAQGHLLIGLIFTMCVSLILGMGLPTLGAYVVLATLGAPALNQLGASLMGAHLFIFYYASISAITPPVCLAAFVSAGIAGANPMKVGFAACRIGLIKFFIPFLFVYIPGLTFEGTWTDIIVGIVQISAVVLPISVISQRYLAQKVNAVEFLLFLAALVLVFTLSIKYLVLSILLQIGGFMLHWIRYKKTLATRTATLAVTNR